MMGLESDVGKSEDVSGGSQRPCPFEDPFSYSSTTPPTTHTHSISLPGNHGLYFTTQDYFPSSSQTIIPYLSL